MSPFFRHIEKPYTQTNSPTKLYLEQSPQIRPSEKQKAPDPAVKQQFK